MSLFAIFCIVRDVIYVGRKTLKSIMQLIKDIKILKESVNEKEVEEKA
jgi:hypothetical protein